MQLQKAPIGLLGAFALKVLGRNPQQFGEAVTPVVEVFDQYLATGELTVSTLSSNVALTASNSRVFTVPNGKVWRLISAGGSYACNAADNALNRRLSVDVKSPNSAPLGAILGASPIETGALISLLGLTFRPPIFLPSGFSVTVSLTASAAWTVAAPFAAELMLQEFDQ